MCLTSKHAENEDAMSLKRVPSRYDNAAPQRLFKVVLSPYPPFRASWPAPYANMQRKKTLAKSRLPGILINASRFHEKCPKCWY